MSSESDKHAMALLREIAESAGGVLRQRTAAAGGNQKATSGEQQDDDANNRTIDVAAFELIFDDAVTDDEALEGLMRDAFRD